MECSSNVDIFPKLAAHVHSLLSEENTKYSHFPICSHFVSPSEAAEREEGVDPDLVPGAERLRVGEGEPGHQAARGLPQGVAAHQIPSVSHRYVTPTYIRVQGELKYKKRAQDRA